MFVLKAAVTRHNELQVCVSNRLQVTAVSAVPGPGKRPLVLFFVFFCATDNWMFTSMRCPRY